jgi:malate dehydrogenase
VEKNLGIGKLNAYEEDLLKSAMPELQRSIDAGEAFAAQKI